MDIPRPPGRRVIICATVDADTLREGVQLVRQQIFNFVGVTRSAVIVSIDRAEKPADRRGVKAWRVTGSATVVLTVDGDTA